MIDLHYAPTPNGWKISIMLEELGLPYTVIPVNIRAGEQFRPEFLAINPNNRIPAIVDHAPVEGAVRRGGAQEHVRADSEGDGGEELTARPLMVRRRPCAVSNHEVSDSATHPSRRARRARSSSDNGEAVARG
jgi:Glutathione S-transferase, N-terminal domain